jgi:phosphoenolpyruvate carboxylase
VILSLTRSAADVMAALYLIQQAGLLQVNAAGHVTASHMDITPLFEKSEALENAVQTMTTLFNNGLYRQHLAQRGDRQLIMLGFSDGIKDAGLFSNAWLMYKTQRDLIALAQNTA